MPVTTARWVLWIGLLVILPFPFFADNWVLLPIINLLKALLVFDIPLSSAAVLLMQSCLGSWLCWLLALAYGHWSGSWPAKIRGSIVGLLLLSAIIILSSVDVYIPLTSGSERLTFLELY
ncbi:hypothetical protein [Oceanicoccus sagamiensis]|uniref:Uncharacterized protein n=1 Tax=Oceanicoccus sagamiensis TaxID=716816 RepID=A0A1X9NLV5_9GAMM|nr:hypothetical protein [Oceanicoccus sagamiensis]ARN75817.1 hypothetical protein BST96_17905 [Oceanicoccus sagamiensis]